MISVEVDVSKEKRMVCILKPYGEVISMPFEIMYTEKDLSELVTMIVRFSDNVKVVMEATGVYHLPILHYLQNNNIFVSVINPYEMKQYLSKGLRKIKTDKHDSMAIAKYGLDYWHGLKEHKSNSEIYDDLKLLSRQYRYYIKMRVDSILTLTHMLDYTMPGIKTLLKMGSDSSKKDKLSDFVEKYWHFDNITKMSEKRFINSYISWAKTKGYHQSKYKAVKIYHLAKDGIPTLPVTRPSVKMLVIESVRVLREVNRTLTRHFTVPFCMYQIRRFSQLCARNPEFV